MKNKNFYSFIVGIILGSIISIIAFTIFITYRIETYCREIEYLNSIIEDQQIRLENLEDKINKNKLIVKKIKVEIKFEEEKNKTLEIQLQKYIKEKYKDIIGKEIDTLDGNVLFQVIDNRIMKFNNKEYKIKVNKIVIAQNLKLYINIKEVKIT